MTCVSTKSRHPLSNDSGSHPISLRGRIRNPTWNFARLFAEGQTGHVRLKRATGRPLIKGVRLKSPPAGRYVHRGLLRGLRVGVVVDDNSTTALRQKPFQVSAFWRRYWYQQNITKHKVRKLKGLYKYTPPPASPPSPML